MGFFSRRKREQSNGAGSSANQRPCEFIVCEAQERQLRSIARERLQNLMAAGIVNPFGPTLNVLALEGVIAPGRKLPVWCLKLNPFSQAAQRVGTLLVNRGVWQDDLSDAIPRYFHCLGATCPTLLLPANVLSKEQSKYLFAAYLSSCDNGAVVLDGVRKFPGNPGDRVSEEMAQMAQNFVAARQRGGRREATKRLNGAEAEELASSLLEPRNQKQEISAFLYAWNGSIEFQGDSGRHLASMSFKAFQDWFGQIVATSHVPSVANESDDRRTDVPRINRRSLPALGPDSDTRSRPASRVPHDVDGDEPEVRDYFGPPRNPAEACLRIIKGNYRRDMVRDALRTDSIESVPALWRAHNLTENLKKFLLARSPDATGGEDLPDLEEGEVEIARLTYVGSTRGEVVSLRARRDSSAQRIRLCLVDEYSTKFHLEQDAYAQVLSRAEIVNVFRNAEPSPLDVEIEWSFSSFFYVDLDEIAKDDTEAALEPDVLADAEDSQGANAIRLANQRLKSHRMDLDGIVEFVARQEGAGRIIDNRPHVVIVVFEDGTGVGVHSDGMDLLRPK